MQNQPVIPSEPRSPFSGPERAALLLLIIAGIGGITLGTRYIGKNLSLPFQLTLTDDESFVVQQEEAEKNAMKVRDTDSDGLNDYDEQEVYGTSPYLSDSDSDGYDDAQELNSGNDPNCPIDSECSRTNEISVDIGEEVASSIEAPEDNSAFLQQLIESGSDPASVQALIENMDPASLRELLSQNGVTSDMLANYSDDELIELYNQVLAEYVASQDSN
ncbi:MAG: hypothetical protein AAB337_00980 [Patescibacteria group bacterium]